MNKNHLRPLLLAATFVLCAPISVSADMVSFNLQLSNEPALPTLSDSDAYATVTIADNVGSMDATLGDVTFTIQVLDTFLTPGTNFGIQAFLFQDLNGLISSNSQFIFAPEAFNWGVEADQNRSIFGLFDWMTKTPDGGGGVNRLVTLVFGIDLMGAMESLWNFVSFAEGSPFAAHIAGFEDTYGDNITSAWFGVVPIPAAVWLFLSGLGALGFLGHRHRRGAFVSFPVKATVQK